MTDTDIVLLIGVALTAVAVLPYWLAHRGRERRSAAAEERARREGLHEPLSLHPVVDPDRCIGTAGCVAVCPEHVLGIRDGQAYAVAPAACIGHGLCERACPVEAIRLVFGTETRGVELPRIRANFETNVPGIFIIGELGGMGLIRNAFEQGRQCIDGIADNPLPGGGDALDLVIVGCGPAGLAASLHARRRGLHFETLEREADVGGAVRHYPRRKVVMTAPVQVPGYGRLAFREIRKEALMDVWEEIVARTGLAVRTGEAVSSVRRDGDAFAIASSVGTVRARRVVLAIGRRGVPRRLGVPGEDSPAVVYALPEPDSFAGERVLVVGGGDSAIEAALALSEQPGTSVWVSYRGDAFSRVKEANRRRIAEAEAGGGVNVLRSTVVRRIESGRVVYTDFAGVDHALGVDRIVVLIGGELPTRFLRECGVQIEMKFGEP